MQAETVRTTVQAIPELARAEARLPRWMIGLGIAGTILSGVIEGPRFAAAFALGAALAILNYHWLHQAIETLFAAGQTRVPRRVVAKFVLRYPLLIAGLFLIYKTAWLPLAPFLSSLFVPVAGVLVGAVLQLIEGWRET